MRILMVGDLVGKPGREAALEMVPLLRSEYKVDFVVVNAENAAGGLGITPDIAIHLLDRGRIDVITLGNHAWAKRDVYAYLDSEPRILRPANYPPGAPGRGYGIYHTEQGPVGVAVLLGRTYMEPVDDPFRGVDGILDDVARTVRTVLVDFHAEATSEKQALGWYVDGRASALLGTHTHVQTADERILPQGSAYITDVGMTGPTHSVIGMKREIVIPRFKSMLPARFEVASGPTALAAVLVDVDMATGRALQIQRLQVPAGEPH